MADTKISALSAIASIAGEDLLAVVDDPAGTPATTKATVTQIRAYIIGLATTWAATQTFADVVIGSANSLAWSTDLFLVRDAADTLAQRRSTNAQTFRVYNTYTDASNYERGFVQWSSNRFDVGVEVAGTGTARALNLRSPTGYYQLGYGITTSPSNILEFYNNTTRRGYIWANGTTSLEIGHENAPIIMVPNTAGGLCVQGSFLRLDEITAPAAPAANKVVVYAVDNGSGKTQLMALFASGAAQQIAIEP